MFYNKFSDIPKSLIKAKPPLIIPMFNQLFYLTNTIKQMDKFNLNNIIILDNGSTYPPLLEWYKTTTLPIVCYPENPGPRDFFLRSEIWNNLPTYFFVSDPDLEFPDKVPNTLVKDLIDLSEKKRWKKIGLALDIKEKDKICPTINIHEPSYWKIILDTTDGGDPIYEALTDTTFAFYNKKYFDDEFFIAPRLAGRYTCKHHGWYYNRPEPKEETEYYRQTQKFCSTIDRS
jgi:hypothetical protein